LFPSILALAVKLINKGSDHTIKYLLAGIVEIEVEVEERLTGKGPLKIFNNSGAENRLATSGNAIKPQEGVSLCLPFCERITLQEPKSSAFLALL
jgi:hypothetical protein